MQLNQLMNESESNATALMGTAAAVFDAVKTLEEPRQFEFWNADASVGNPQLTSRPVVSARPRFYLRR